MFEVAIRRISVSWERTVLSVAMEHDQGLTIRHEVRYSVLSLDVEDCRNEGG